MNDRLMKVEEVAAQLGVPRSWVYTAAESGRLPSLKIGKYRRFDPIAVAAWLAEQQADSRLKNTYADR